MGAGRIVYQDLTRIDKAIRDGDLAANPALRAAIARCADGAHALHFVGLVSDGGVHSHQRHLHALLELAAAPQAPARLRPRDHRRPRHVAHGQRPLRRRARKRAAPHRRTDRHGHRPLLRDGPRQAMGPHEARLRRDGGRPRRTDGAIDALAAVRRVARRRTSPTSSSSRSSIVDADGHPVGPIRDGDSVVFFNFRADRARQLTRALALDDFDGFERSPRPGVPLHDDDARTTGRSTFPVVFDAADVHAATSPTCSRRSGRTNLRLAETEKYAHVTYFFNCGREEPYRGEDRMLVPSQKVATYDLMPEMSAPGIADALVDDLETAAPRRRDLQLRERRHGRPHGQPRRDDRGGRDARRLPRADRHGRSRPRTAPRSSPPITATPSRCGTTS